MGHLEQDFTGTWSVHRQDDNGNRFIVSTGLGHEEAIRLAAELESRGHKQFYWVERDRGFESNAGTTGEV
jgi:hypothetical protein